MLRPLAAAALILAAASARAQEAGSSPPVLTLDQAVALAEAQNRPVKNALLEVSVGDDQIAEARTYRFPSINFYGLGSQLLTPVEFTFQRGVFGTFPGIGPVPGNDTSIRTPLRPTFYGVVQLAQPLSQQYKVGLSIRQARLAKLVNEQKLRAQKQLVKNQVRQAYYAILQTQSKLASSEENLKFDRELERTTEELVREKAALVAESMSVKARIGLEEYNNLTLRNALASQKEQLNVLLGRDVRTEFSVAEVAEAGDIAMSLEAAQAKALGARPELLGARLRVEQAELNRRTVKAEYIPDVSLTVTNLSLSGVNLLPSNVATAGVLVTWDPLDWGRRRRELAAAGKQIAESKNTAEETEAQVLVDVAAKYRKLGESRALLHAAQLQLEAERERLRVTMNQYAQKAALLKDVLQQRSSLESAASQQSQALLAYWIARADFEKSLGQE
ncbi:MAG TPA: TolC family protein [Methylomirabilota bacterium]|nr:TolC family protein [Methylomirabilota bacterium]